jgi:hypothetical protein
VAGRRGRPPKPDEDRLSSTVQVGMTAKEYDEIYQEARRQGISVPEYFRRQLRRELPTRRVSSAG